MADKRKKKATAANRANATKGGNAGKRGKSNKPSRRRSRERETAQPPTPPPGVITIRKYANRRLYDTASSAHITQEDLYRMVGRGAVVRIIDASTDEDITNQTLALALIEHDPAKLRLMPTWLLHQMIRLHEQALGGWLGPLWQMPAAPLGGAAAWPGFAGTWPAGSAVAGWNPFIPRRTPEPPAPTPPDAGWSIEGIRLELDRLMRRLGELENGGRAGLRE